MIIGIAAGLLVICIVLCLHYKTETEVSNMLYYTMLDRREYSKQDCIKM